MSFYSIQLLHCIDAAWVDTAFGPYWAFQKGWLSWLSGVTDNALYPILFLDCLVGLLSEDADHPSMFAANGRQPLARWSFIVTTVGLLTYLNYRGLDIVGKLAIAICLLSLMPFIVFCVIGATKVDPTRWFIAPPGGIYGVNWSLLFNTFFWNINFWVSCSTCSLVPVRTHYNPAQCIQYHLLNVGGICNIIICALITNRRALRVSLAR